jgi:aminoglycoside phosphotransferase (APT) family kinase protein
MARRPDLEPAAVEALLSRVFGTSTPLAYHRTPDGVSTQVYRVMRGGETFYLRVAEEADENLETDAELHRRLHDAGVKVARVVHVEAFHTPIGRSVMVTTEVPGRSLADRPAPVAIAESVVREAGADLAVVNQQPVDGFGWVRRHGPGWPLRAEYPAFDPFLTSYLPEPWPGPLTSLFPAPALHAIEEIVEQQRQRPPARAHLAHGDFDLTQIFHRAGRYRGLIDFGEIRGTEPLFDLGHFHLHDQDTVPARLLPALLAGYQQVRPLPADHEQSIRHSAVLLGLRQLCRWLGPTHGRGPEHPALRQRASRISELLADPASTGGSPRPR